MGFYTLPDGTRYHLQEVKRARVVPGHARHSWSRIPQRGQVATCRKCGCQKCYRLNYETVYRLAGSEQILTERPDCTGTPAPASQQLPDDGPDNALLLPG